MTIAVTLYENNIDLLKKLFKGSLILYAKQIFVITVKNILS